MCLTLVQTTTIMTAPSKDTKETDIYYMFAHVRQNQLVADPNELQIYTGTGPSWTTFNKTVHQLPKKKSEKFHYLIPPSPVLYGPSVSLWDRIAQQLPPIQFFGGEWEVWESGKYPREPLKMDPSLTELRVTNIAQRPVETPSTGGRPVLFAEEQKKNPIAMGRPKTADHYDVPVSLLHPAFAQFKKNLVSGWVDAKLSPLAFRWIRELSEFFPAETDREAKFHELLSDLLEFKISKKTYRRLKTDGGLDLNDPKDRLQNFIDLYVKPILVEVKAETTCGIVDAVFQSILYDQEAIRVTLTDDQYNGPWRKTRLASIIIIHNGPNVQVLGVVWLAKQYVEVLSPSFPLHFNEFDTQAFENLLRFMTSLRTLFQALLKLYQEPDLHAVQHDQVTFPYPSSYDALENSTESSNEAGTASVAEPVAEPIAVSYLTNDEVAPGSSTDPGSVTSKNKVQFRYIKRVDPIRLVFTAQTTEGENIIIKFGYGRYGLDAHKAAAKVHLAPGLLGYSKLTGGWWMVAMELLHEDFQSCAQVGVDDACKSVIRSSIHAFRAMGFVHGDLRASNVLVRKCGDQWECKLIDFDWAGCAGQVTYPYAVYRTSSVYRPMVNMDQLPITYEHDNLTLDNMLSECKR
ncbi:hypothetical protein D9757_010881 [Collybiopsis confluens]|uniref:Uncharacterized protein n=1 Tax=Collybiopsis confluens TaxID=2823264 RepID=A0A8H5M2K2_9AGAR|nr:hypothetical protein D9757_010881 [Collybiopsis confluens]